MFVNFFSYPTTPPPGKETGDEVWSLVLFWPIADRPGPN
jgi:hypothetical protein